MSLNINKWDVLVVNKHWLVLGTITIRKALTAIHSSPDGNALAAKAFDIQRPTNESGEYIFDNNEANPIPLELSEWLNVDIRPFDSVIHTSKRIIRVPTVIMAQNCDKTHLRDIKLTSRNVMERDNYTCQYTGKKLPRHRLNIDHIISRDEWKRRNLPGSPDNWRNMVTSDKDVNSFKGNKPLKDTGLTLLKEPKEPLPIPAAALIKEIRHIDWEIFLGKLNFDT